MADAPCCPPGSQPYLRPDHQQAGSIVMASGEVPCYSTGNPASPAAVVMVPDVWGWNGGRTRAIADHVATALDALVLVPRLLDLPVLEGNTDGDGLPPDFNIEKRMKDFMKFARQHSWAALRQKVEAVLAHVAGKRVGMTGFCWGGWLLCHASALSKEVLCGVIAHPSIGLEQMLGGSPPALAGTAQCPILFMPAGNDPPSYVPGGDIYGAVKARSPATEAIPFPDMLHGWVPRGDLGDEKVRRDVEKAVGHMTSYLAEHLGAKSKL